MDLQNAILATLAYHDIFDYPLTIEEIHRYLIGKKATWPSSTKILTQLLGERKIGERQDLYSQKNSVYFLAGRSKIVSLRLQRAKFSQAKLKRAQFFANILKLIPTIKLVAVSGALAMQNSHRKDDIDLVIICSENTLWATRFLANLILAPFKRYPKSSLISDRACLNIFIDQSDLGIRPHNLYLAHEICQMNPLWDRRKTYSRFVKANRWVTKVLPNWTPPFPVIPAKAGIQQKKASVVNGQLSIVERTLRSFQLWYMRPKITNEKIGEHQLFFHPANTAEWVIEEYQKRLKKLKVL